METSRGRVLAFLRSVVAAATAAFALAYIAHDDFGLSRQEIRTPAVAAAGLIGAVVVIDCAPSASGTNLKSYADYYNGVRTHRSLNKDAPVSRSVQRAGVISSRAILGGLHHHYVRI